MTFSKASQAAVCGMPGAVRGVGRAALRGQPRADRCAREGAVNWVLEERRRYQGRFQLSGDNSRIKSGPSWRGSPAERRHRSHFGWSGAGVPVRHGKGDARWVQTQWRHWGVVRLFVVFDGRTLWFRGS